MPTSQTTATFILDQLSGLSPNVRVRKMFGEYALYYHNRVVALICEDTLFVKISNQGKSLLGSNYLEGIPYPTAKQHIMVEEEIINDRELLSQLIIITYNSLPMKK